MSTRRLTHAQARNGGGGGDILVGVDPVQAVENIERKLSEIILKLDAQQRTTTSGSGIAPVYMLIMLVSLSLVCFISLLHLAGAESRMVALVPLVSSVVAAGAVLLASGMIRVGPQQPAVVPFEKDGLRQST